MTAAEITCVVDVSVRRGDGADGWFQVRSRQAERGGVVTAVTSADSRAEAACWTVEDWAVRLARLVEVSVPEGPTPPDPELEVPFDVLLAAGEAVRTGRPDVLDELVRRATPPDPAALRDQLVRLHTAVVGRLLAVVAGRDGSAARAGWVSWLLFSDGWRALTPARRDRQPVVLLTPAEPHDLGRQVAAQVALVRGTR